MQGSNIWQELSAPFPPFDELVRSYEEVLERQPGHDVSDEPRDESGRWTEGGGGEGGGGGADGALPKDIRPPEEDVHEVADASFEFSKQMGHQTMPIEKIKNTISAGDDPKRIEDLKAAMKSEG